MQRSIDSTIGRRPSRLIVHRSLIATTSRTISCDGSCHRCSPMVRDNATNRRDRSRCATAAGDRSKYCRSVAPWPNRKQSYDPEIVRSGVNMTLARPRVGIDRGMRPLLEIVAHIADRSHHGPIATNRTTQKWYDPV